MTVAAAPLTNTLIGRVVAYDVVKFMPHTKDEAWKRVLDAVNEELGTHELAMNSNAEAIATNEDGIGPAAAAGLSTAALRPWLWPGAMQQRLDCFKALRCSGVSIHSMVR